MPTLGRLGSHYVARADGGSKNTHLVVFRSKHVGVHLMISSGFRSLYFIFIRLIFDEKLTVFFAKNISRSA